MVLTRSTAAAKIEQKQVKFELESQRLGHIEWSDTRNSVDVKHIVYIPFEFTMEAKLMNTILSNDLNKWPKFSGKRDENVNKWVKEITNELNMVKLSDEQKRSVIQTFLLDDARRWFISNMATMLEWDTFVTGIQNAFSSKWLQEAAIKKISSRQQGMAETILHYYTEMIELFDTIDLKMTDNMKVIYLTTGVKSSIKKEILRQAPKTPAEFLEVAQAEEKLDFTSVVTYEEEENTTENSLSVLRTSGKTVNPATERRGRSTINVRCHRCHKMGHIARNCFSKNC